MVTSERKAVALRRFLLFLSRASLEIGNEKTAIFRTYTALRDGQESSIARIDFKDAVDHYASKLRSIQDLSIIATTNVLSRKALLDNLSSGLQDLAPEGLWPDIGPIKGMLVGRLTSSNIPSLGELSPGSSREESRKIADTANYATIISLGRSRLIQLRKVLEVDLAEAEEDFDRGQRALRDEAIPLSDIREATFKIPARYNLNNEKTPEIVRKCFPLNDADKRLSSLLRYIKHFHGNHFNLRDLPWQLQLVVGKSDGVDRIHAHLEGQMRAIIAAWMIVAIDSGLNIQPIDDLRLDPFIGSVKRGKLTLRTIGEFKNRANGAPVDGHLIDGANDGDIELAVKVPDTRFSAVEAIRCWQKLRAPMQLDAENSGGDIANRLWVVRAGTNPRMIKRIDAAVWKHNWNVFLADHADDPVIGRLPIQRRMIRTTLTHLADSDHSGDARIVAKLAQHQSSRTTSRYYLNRGYMKRRLDELIREFQKLLEARMAPEGIRCGEQLGISSTELRSRRTKAVENGLGFTCVDPWAGAQPDQKSKMCTKLDACSTCPLLRFVPSPDAVKALVLFHRSLEAAQKEFAARNPERWVHVWIPALALTIATTQLLASGSKRRMLETASREIDRAIESGSAKLLQLW